MAILDFLKKNFTRKAYRRGAKFSVSVVPIKVKNTRDWIQSEYYGAGTNISPKGLQIETIAPLAVGDLVHFHFALREGSKMVEVQGITRNVRASEGGNKVVGFEFSNPSPEVVKYLATILLLYK
ncbi:MAG: PilZ domain-containing protein [Bdellovibrionia bacterium]